LKSVTAHNKGVSNNILKDIVDLQWSVLNDASFYKVFSLLEEKYLGNMMFSMEFLLNTDPNMFITGAKFK
jgi:hypothetical protein